MLIFVYQSVALYQKEMSYAGEIVPLSEMFFNDMPEFGEEEKEVFFRRVFWD
jgi:hypothetical protein